MDEGAAAAVANAVGKIQFVAADAEVVCPLAAALTIRRLRSQWQICRRTHPAYTRQQGPVTSRPSFQADFDSQARNVKVSHGWPDVAEQFTLRKGWSVTA